MRTMVAAGVIVKRNGKVAQVMRGEDGPLLVRTVSGKIERLVRLDIKRPVTIRTAENFLPKA